MQEEARLINQFLLNVETMSKQNGIRNSYLSDFGLVAIGDGFTKLESLSLYWCLNVTYVGLIYIVAKCKFFKCLDLEVIARLLLLPFYCPNYRSFLAVL